MNAGAGLPTLKKSELFERLAQGRSAAVTVVTPNKRLSEALARDFDAHQRARSLSVWESADVLLFSTFVERCYEDALYSELASRLPVLLSGAQEQALWEAIIRASEEGKSLLSVRGAAKLAVDAWKVAHEWKLAPRLEEFPANDDPRIFSGWAWRYQGMTERDGQTEQARLPEILTEHLAHASIRKPKMLVAYGFDVLKPQQSEFLAKLEAAGTELLTSGLDECISESHRVALPSARDEIHAAADWARSRLEAGPEARIGVVVPNLGKARNAVRRIFAQALAPGRALYDAEGAPLPFDFSLGEPLASAPLVAAALLVVEIARGEFDFSLASRLLRSPFVAGAESERAARAQLDAALRRDCASRLDLAGLRRAISHAASNNRYGAPPCPILSRRLSDLAELDREQLSGAKRPSEWARAFSALLDAAGFPGERDPDSSEYQALKKFHDAVADFATLDRVAGRIRFEEARESLRGALADTLFQPEAPDVPIQVLGVLESAGMEFDHLWVMGLTDDVWPIPARPNPFIPVALQRAVGVPESSAASALELDRRITRGWLAAAREVVFSHALREEDRDLAPSPLIRDVSEASLDELSSRPRESFRELIRRARREERVTDDRGPTLLRSPSPAAIVPGGTGIFRDQAACPFRAFARHRLGAKGLETPPAGLDPRDRGILVHETLKSVWTELVSKARLDALKSSERDALLDKAATEALARLRRTGPGAIGSRLARLEKARLIALAREWLELEQRRPDFEISELEAKRQVSFGGITVNARLDRSDRLAGGARAIIDYKTGEANIGAWLGERPDEPQLPIYAVATGDEVAAVAFACVKAGETRFRGLARKDKLIPGVDTLEETRAKGAKAYPSWRSLVEGWRKELDALGSAFAAGDARVDPKEKAKLKTCRICDVQSLCRIYERFGAPIDDEGGRNTERSE